MIFSKAKIKHAFKGAAAASWETRADIGKRAAKRGAASLPPVLASQWLLLKSQVQADLNEAAAGFLNFIDVVPLDRTTLAPIALAIATAFAMAFGSALLELFCAVPLKRRKERKQVLAALAEDPDLFSRIQDEIEGVPDSADVTDRGHGVEGNRAVTQPPINAYDESEAEGDVLDEGDVFELGSERGDPADWEKPVAF